MAAAGERPVVAVEDREYAAALVMEWSAGLLPTARITTLCQLELVGMVTAALAEARSRERGGLVTWLQARRRDTLRALRASTDAGADYWRWQGHAELSRQLLERLGAAVPQ